MPDAPTRAAFVPRHAVTHEMTAEGPRIVADQVVTAETDARPKPPPAPAAAAAAEPSSPLPNDSAPPAAAPAPDNHHRPARRRGPAEE